MFLQYFYAVLVMTRRDTSSRDLTTEDAFRYSLQILEIYGIRDINYE